MDLRYQAEALRLAALRLAAVTDFDCVTFDLHRPRNRATQPGHKQLGCAVNSKCVLFAHSYSLSARSIQLEKRSYCTKLANSDLLERPFFGIVLNKAHSGQSITAMASANKNLLIRDISRCT